MGGDARRLLTGGAVSQAEKSALDLETSGAAGGPWGPVSRCRVYLSVYVSVPMWVNYRLPGADLPLAPPPAGPTQLLIYSWIQGPHQSDSFTRRGRPCAWLLPNHFPPFHLSPLSPATETLDLMFPGPPEKPVSALLTQPSGQSFTSGSTG